MIIVYAIGVTKAQTGDRELFLALESGYLGRDTPPSRSGKTSKSPRDARPDNLLTTIITFDSIFLPILPQAIKFIKGGRPKTVKV